MGYHENPEKAQAADTNVDVYLNLQSRSSVSMQFRRALSSPVIYCPESEAWTLSQHLQKVPEHSP
jgi:hypothetical protein